MRSAEDLQRDQIAQAAMRNNLINMSLQPQAARLAGRVGQHDAAAPGVVPLDGSQGVGSAPAPTFGGTPPLPGGATTPYRIPMFPPMAGGLPGGGGGSMTSSLGSGGGFAGGGGGAPGMSNYNPTAALPQPGGGDIAAPPVEQPADPAGAAGATVGFSGGNMAGASSAGAGSGK